MIFAILILTGVQFATNPFCSVQYALDTQRGQVASVSLPQILTSGEDVISNCYDFTAGRQLTPDECNGSPIPKTFYLSLGGVYSDVYESPVITNFLVTLTKTNVDYHGNPIVYAVTISPWRFIGSGSGDFIFTNSNLTNKDSIKDYFYVSAGR